MKKPIYKLTGTDGNIFALAGQAQKALRKAGLHEEAKELIVNLRTSQSYDEALQLIMQYWKPNKKLYKSY